MSMNILCEQVLALQDAIKHPAVVWKDEYYLALNELTSGRCLFLKKPPKIQAFAGCDYVEDEFNDRLEVSRYEYNQ